MMDGTTGLLAQRPHRSGGGYFGYLLRQVTMYGRKRGLEVGDCFAVTLIKVGIKPVEKSVTSPIVLQVFLTKNKALGMLSLHFSKIRQ